MIKTFNEFINESKDFDLNNLSTISIDNLVGKLDQLEQASRVRMFLSCHYAFFPFVEQILDKTKGKWEFESIDCSKLGDEDINKMKDEEHTIFFLKDIQRIDLDLLRNLLSVIFKNEVGKFILAANNADKEHFNKFIDKFNEKSSEMDKFNFMFEVEFKD